MRTTTRAALLVATLAIAATGCSDDDGDTTEAGGATSSTTAAAAPSSTAAGDDDEMTADTGMDDEMEMVEVTGIAVATSSLGDVLVLDGMPVYAFDRDTPESSSCVDNCASAWPPVPADAELAEGVEVTVGSITRDDGSEQLTINGAPVYTFDVDTALPADGSGEPAGQGASEAWWVIAADGNPMRDIPAN